MPRYPGTPLDVKTLLRKASVKQDPSTSSSHIAVCTVVGVGRHLSGGPIRLLASLLDEGAAVLAQPIIESLDDCNEPYEAPDEGQAQVPSPA